MPEPIKSYLGDAVYASYDGYYIKLTTEDGRDETNVIILDPEVLTAFVRFVERITGGKFQEKTGS